MEQVLGKSTGKGRGVMGTFLWGALCGVLLVSTTAKADEPKAAPTPNSGAQLILPGQTLQGTEPVPPPPSAEPTVAPTQTFAPTTAITPPAATEPASVTPGDVIVAPTVVASPPPPPPVPLYPPSPAEFYTQPPPRDRHFGAHAEFGGAVGENTLYAGAAVGLRFRPNMGVFALQFGLGCYVGVDYNERTRAEVPVTLDAYFFFNPRQRIQFYATVGAGVSWASATETEWWGRNESSHYTEAGGRAGLGMEVLVAQRIGIHFDVRGMLRENISNKGAPEFFEVDDEGAPTGRVTNTSYGLLVGGGATFYF